MNVRSRPRSPRRLAGFGSMLRTLTWLALAGLPLFVAGHRVDAQPPTTAQLGGEERFVSTLATDKPTYRPGETVWLRGVLLHAFDHRPAWDRAEYATVSITDPKGSKVATLSTSSQRGSWGMGWPVPEGQAGGVYKAKVSFVHSGHAPAEREFEVRNYRPPRLKTQIEFLRDGYGPGDEVVATLEAKRAEGGLPSGAKTTAVARVDEVEVARVPGEIDGQGRCQVRFRLPKRIARGVGTLAFVIEDGGVVETASKTLPILLQTLDLSFYPEGGELVAGLPNRVYLEARTPADKPADLKGFVREVGATARAAEVSTSHEGRGRFALSPRPGASYELVLEQPAGISRAFPLPAIKAQGAVLQAGAEVYEAGAPITFAVAGQGHQQLVLELRQRERLLEARKLNVQGSALQSVSLDAKEASGVLIATLWDEAKAQALAERLVFRRPRGSLALELLPSRKSYAPGDTVELTLRARRNGKPVEAILGVTVTDDAVLELTEKREQAPRLPAMIYLEPEVRELADASVYLDPKNPKAPQALDLLLGTQGWRRIVWQDLPSFLAQHGDEGRRAMALRIVSRRERVTRRRRGGVIIDGLVLEEAAAPPPARPGRPPRAAQAPPPKGAVPPPAAVERRPAKLPLRVGGKKGKKFRRVARGPRRSEPRKDLQDALDRHQALEKRALGEDSDDEMPMRQAGIQVRVYAHEVRPGRKANDRIDFTETLYWNAGLRTDPKTGEVKIRFGLNDSVTSFRAIAEGYTQAGELGAASSLLLSKTPFYVEPKAPLEVTRGDRIDLPIVLVNSLSEPLEGARVQVSAGDGLEPGEPHSAVDLGPDARKRQLVPVEVGAGNGPVKLTLSAQAGQRSDTVVREIIVRPDGFPMERNGGGILSADKPATLAVQLPETVVPGSVVTEASVYPSPVASLDGALERLIREPNGCFEQTSSTTYPLTLAQSYFMTHSGVDPELIRRAREKLEKGYKRLVGFECKKGGYEWFGQDPGHEALTAYGLMQFSDMAEVREVDSQMLERTRAWLFKQRDGKGGFHRKRRALHTWVEDRDASNAYITWSLLESGEKGLEAEVAEVKRAAAETRNSYVVALSANVLQLAGDTKAARELLDRLTAKQTKDGQVEGATGSIVGSRGSALAIETTSLATLAWLRSPDHQGEVEKAMRYIAQSCEAGRYGSTQSTVLALKAILAYDADRAKPKAPGTVRLYVDDIPVGPAMPFGPERKGALILPDFSRLLRSGRHRVQLRMKDGSPMPYSVSVRYSAYTPASSEECPVKMELGLTRAEVTEGEPLEARLVVENRSQEPLPTPIAIVGLPGGVEPRHAALKELVKSEQVAAYEVRGREIVLYWRALKPSQRVELSLSLLAAVPGRYTGPASRAYLYYGDEHKTWLPGLAVQIKAKPGA